VVLDRVTLRRSAIAYLYRENPPLSRDENLKFYDRVTASSVEVTQFSIQGPELVLVRPPAPGVGPIEIRVGTFATPAPQLRLLVSELPVDRPAELVWETADLVWDAFRVVWGPRVGEPSLTEVTLEYVVPAPEGSREFLTQSVAKINPASLHHLGREFEGFGLRFMSSPAIHLGSGQAPILSGAAVEVRIETLIADLSQLFIQATIKWPPLNVPVQQLPTALQSQVQGPVVQANLRAEKPTHYLKQSHDFVVNNVSAFLRHAAD
jgi:hypothetical protein